MKRLIILGAGGFGQTVGDLAWQSGRYDAIFFLDDCKTGAEVLGKLADYPLFISDETEMLPALGNNGFRLELAKKIELTGAVLATIVHVRAYVSPTVVIAPGTIVLPMAVINTQCKVGRACIVNCGAMIDHGCVVEDGVHVCIGAAVKAENRIAALSKIEACQVVESRTFPL